MRLDTRAHATHAQRDESEAIPWHTARDAREAAARMKTWAPNAISQELHRISDADWHNLARVALELRPR